MSTPYRNEIDALKGRKAALEQEVAHVDVLLKDAERRRKRMLDVIQVASPCSAKWDEMLGDERVRFCLSCEKNVYNLSALPREEAERFVQEHAASGNDVCVRFYQRADGTVMTADCPVGQKRKRRKKLALAVAGAGALAAGALAAFDGRPRVAQGALSTTLAEPAVYQPVPPAATVPTTPPAVPEATPPHVMGRMVAQPQPPRGHWLAGGLQAAPSPTK